MIEKEINESYMEWLDSFSNLHSRFYDDEFIFNPKISMSDKINVSKLNVLYGLVRKYARVYGINTSKDNDISYYGIKHNDNYYKIGYEFDSVCCIRKKDKSEYIDSDDLLYYQSNKCNPNIDTKIKLLETIIDDLLKEGMLPSMVEATTKKVLKR